MGVPQDAAALTEIAARQRLRGLSGFSNHSDRPAAVIFRVNTRGFIELACVAGCLACSAAVPATQHNSDPAETARLKFEAFDRHDAAAIQEIYGTNAVLHSPDYPELTGNAPIADTYRGLFAAIPDAKDVVQSSAVVGDKVYVQFILTGHFGGAADKPIHAPIMSIYTIKAGHIIADTTYYDRKVP